MPSEMIALAIPPGIVRSGTELESIGRWRDASLVRWREGIMRPVGGWRAGVDVATTNPPRGALAWKSNNGTGYIAIGTATELYAVDDTDNITDITPADLTAGLAGAGSIGGYGSGVYGSDVYGGVREPSGTTQAATVWHLDTWGENLIAMSTADKRILEWDLNVLNNAAPVTNAPTNNKACMVTAERFLVALGADGDPRLVQWSDREDNTVWTAATTNQAGSIPLQTAGAIQCGIRTRGQSLILTDADAHTMTYVGGQFVYGFERVGTGCGIITPLAKASTDAGVFWMGRNSFFKYAGGAVEKVPCTVQELIFADLNVEQQSKIHAIAMLDQGEVWWFYPGPSGDVDRYVAYSYVEDHWTCGFLARTTGVGGAVFGFPIMVDASGQMYDHETGFDYHGSEIYIESGPIQLGKGEAVMHAVQLIPDERTQGDTTAWFSTKFHPNNTKYAHGPYAMANPTDIRFTGREIAMKIVGSEGVDWRVGIPRLRVFPGGER